MQNIFLLFLVLLAGCASSTEVASPNGKKTYQVKCGNAVKEKCTEKASEICPQGYNELERNADAYADMTKVGNIGLLEIKADTSKIMLIQCK